MRPIFAFTLGLASAVGALTPGCGSSGGNSGFMAVDSGGSSGGSGGGSSGGGSGGGSGSSSGSLIDDAGSSSSSGGGDGGTTVMTTVYANTDDTLYSVNPMTNAVTTIGKFSGTATMTDVAVNGSGDVYVNSETAVYRAALPAGGTGTVNLTMIATISGSSSNHFYALGFAPAGALDPANEVLVGGDGSGVLWAINTTSGMTKQLGSFGKDPTRSGNTFELSGDVVFYLDAQGNPTGLATIRSCQGGSSCGNDFLAAVNMANLKAAYTSGTPATTLLAGIYGGSSPDAGKVSLGPGTGFHDVFGLGAWSSKVFGFTRDSNGVKPTLLSIDTATGAGSALSTSSTFTNGWSGAGVTTKVTVSVPQPPPIVQ